MVGNLTAGDLVEHRMFGLGKVIHTEGGAAVVYFKGKEDPIPENRTTRFPLPTEYLVSVEYRPDPVLDNLPPWKDGRFSRFETKADIQKAKARFLQQFPRGFDDPEYFRRERGYKEAAHERYRGSFEPQARKWIQNRDASALVNGLCSVYGEPSALKGSRDERLNLLYQKIQEPAYFDALKGGGDHLFLYVEAALGFTDSSTQETFDALVKALLDLPTRAGGASLDNWTTLTWLPFIAKPAEQMLVKPTITQTFASILPFEIRYRSELNFETYRRAVNMARRLGEELQHSEANLSQRPLDMIDVQSFMWVAIKYAEPGPG